MALTVVLMLAVGREFMPELEEGNLWIRGKLPVNIALPESAKVVREARAIMRSYPEVATIVSQLGRPDDGTDTSGFNNMEFFVPLKPQKQWPAVKSQTRAWRAGSSAPTPAHKAELINDMNAELSQNLLGVDWNFSQNIRDNVMESLSGIKGDNSRENRRSGPRRTGTAGRQDEDVLARHSRVSRTWGSSTSRGSRTWSSPSIARSASAGA